MRTWLSSFALAVTVTAPAMVAAQAPPAVGDLPTEQRAGPIGQALQARDWPQAEQLIVAALEQAPKSPGLLTLLGSVFLAERKPLNAAIAIKKAEALAPLDERARFNLVLAYLSLKRGDWARPELVKLAQANPANAVYEYWQGRLDYDDAQYASAVEHFSHVIARDPSFVRAYDNLGLAYEALNELDKALPVYREAVTRNRAAATPSAWPCLNLAALLRTRGELDEAETLLREALRYDPGFAAAHYQLGMVLERQGKIDEAVALLRVAVERDQAYADPHYALMRLYRRLGREADAAAELATFERLHDQKRAEHAQ